MPNWRVTPEWADGHCFIIAGGPSVLQQDLTLLNGHRVIVINSSHEAYPNADFLIFADSRWWFHNKNKVVSGFKGRIVSLSSTVHDPRILILRRATPKTLSRDAGAVSIQFTTLVSALNFAMLLGVKSICLLGADGKASEGRTHHHSPHPWKVVPGCWDKQRTELAIAARDLKEAGVECVNASPESAWADLWPIIELKDYVARSTAAVSQAA